MGVTIGVLCVILLAVFMVQVGKARELASIVRNDPAEQDEMNKFQAGLGMFFMVAFLAACVVSFIYYIPTSLGWGPNIAASKHGPDIDYLFNLTLFFTFIVFVLTHIALFWFAWKYKGRQGRVGLYWAHNETLEMVWMIIPSVVMTFLVVGGLSIWNNIMTDIPEEHQSVALPDADNEYIEIEATGSQFLWYLRYPGRDGKIGTKEFTEINSENPLGQIWSDEKNMDDFMTTEIVLPENKKVRVRVTSRDVLHNFYIRDMRVKIDAIPGMPTYFIFTPTVTTDSMRRRLSNEPQWQVPDKNDATKQRWETFNYELACAELCGKGHYSMRNLVKIVSEEEYLEWLDAQEGGKLAETADSLGNKSYSYEKGSVKSQYFATAYKTSNPLTAAKTDNLEKLVENKLKVNAIAASLKETRNKAAEGSAAYTAAQKALTKIKEIQKVMRLTNNVSESNTKLAEAEQLAGSAVVIETPMPDSVVTDTTK